MSDCLSPIRAAQAGANVARLDHDAVTCANCRHRAASIAQPPGMVETIASARCGRFHARAKTILFESDQGSLTATIYSGWAARWWMSEAAAPQLIAFLLPGDFVDLAQSSTGSAAERITALTDVTFCSFADERRSVLLGCPDIAERMLAAEQRWRRIAEERMLALTVGGAAAALCHFLLSLHCTLQARRLAGPASFTLPVSRAVLARALGITTVHLRRLLQQLADDEVLELAAPGKVTLLDRARAQAIARVSTTAAAPGPLL